MPSLDTRDADDVEGAPARRDTAPLVAVAVAVLATRVPFLVVAPDLGGDVDATRLMLAGRAFAETGVYHNSRTPAYPAVELVATVLAGVPDRVLLALTALCGAIAVTAFADLLRTLRVRTWLPLTAAFALTPVVYLADLTFMDYSWAGAAGTVGLAVLARGRVTLGAVMLGLAVACRPAAVVMVLVGVVVLACGDGGCRSALRLVSLALAAATPFYLLPLMTFGPEFVTFADQSSSWLVVAGRMSTGVWGWAGSVVLLGALITAAARFRRWFPRRPSMRRSWTVGALAGVAATIVMFLRLPVEPGYLLPLVPLSLLLVGMAFRGPLVATALAVSLAVSSFAAPGGRIYGTTVPDDMASRRATTASVEAATRAIQALPPGSTVVLGADLARVVAAGPDGAIPAPTPLDDVRGETPSRRMALPGGVLAVYALDRRDPRPRGLVLRGPRGAPASLPLLRSPP